MGFEDFDVYKTLSMYRRRYVLALALVATLAVSAFMANYQVIQSQSEDGVRINIAGRQRMLSQRMALFATMYSQQESPARREALRVELLQMHQLFARSHRALLEGNAELGLKHPVSDERVEGLYFGDAALDSRVQAYMGEIDTILALPGDSPETSAQLERIHREAASLLPLLDQATTWYEIQSAEHVERLFMLELGIMMTMLLVLVLEGLLIFRPMDHTLHEQLDLIRKDGIDLELLTSRMQILLDSTGDGVVTLTGEGRFGEMHNEQFEAWFGRVEPGADALEVIFEEPHIREQMRLMFEVHSRTHNIVTLAAGIPKLLEYEERSFALRAHHARMPEPRLILLFEDLTSEHRVMDAHDTLEAKQQLFSNMLLAMHPPLYAVEDQAAQIKRDTTQQEIEQYATNITVLVKQLISSIEEPIQLSDMRGGHLVFRPSVFAIEEFIAQVIQAITPGAELQHNTLQAMIEPGLSTVYTDRTKLFHLFVNILTRFNTLIDYGVLRIVVRTQHKQQQKRLLCELVCRNKRIYSEPKISRKREVVWQPVFEHDDEEIPELSPETMLTQKLCEAMGAELFERSDEAEGLFYRVIVPINQSTSAVSRTKIKTPA